ALRRSERLVVRQRPALPGQHGSFGRDDGEAASGLPRRAGGDRSVFRVAEAVRAGAAGQGPRRRPGSRTGAVRCGRFTKASTTGLPPKASNAAIAGCGTTKHSTCGSERAANGGCLGGRQNPNGSDWLWPVLVVARSC